MITLNVVHQVLNKNLLPLKTEQVTLLDSLGKVIAQDVFSDMDMPPFDKSAMDGYACRKMDLGNPLVILETIAAGTIPAKTVTEGTCAKIMTGAKIPAGADTVVMIEDCEIINTTTVRCMNEKTKTNICKQAEDIANGECVIVKGTKIEPQHIAIMASVGCIKPAVFKAPLIGVVATGSELVEAHEQPQHTQIRNSNSEMICSQLKQIGINGRYYGIAPDARPELKACLQKALGENDGVIVTGGVSVGEFDLVPEILEEMELTIHFSTIAIQPGKPVKFASTASKFCFALSGNPVSSMLQFRLLAKPYLLELMGNPSADDTVQVKLLEDYRRNQAKRQQFVPVKLTPEGASLIKFNGSAHIYAFSGADAYMEVPVGVKEYKKESMVYVRSIQ